MTTNKNTTGDKPSLFRKKAMDRLAVPTEDAQLLQVTDGRGWLALLATAIMLGGVMFWACIGHISVRVKGPGLLMYEGGVAQVDAGASGRLTDFSVKQGMRVEQDQQLGYVAQPELAVELRQARDAVSRAKNNYEQKALPQPPVDVAYKLKANALKQVALNIAVSNLWIYHEQLQEKVTAKTQLLKEGLITSQTLLQSQQELTANEDSIRQSAVDQIRLHAEDEAMLLQAAEELRQLKETWNGAQEKLEQLETRLKYSVGITCPYDGTILEILTREGSLVDASTPVLILEPTRENDSTLEAVIFLPARDGIKVKTGMPAYIEPDFATKEEYGYIKGQVISSGRFPVSRERMGQLLHNKVLEDQYGGSATMEARVLLSLDPQTPSGYAWTSSAGYPEKLRSGLGVQVEVVVKQVRPISLLLPFLKRLLDPRL